MMQQIELGHLAVQLPLKGLSGGKFRASGALCTVHESHIYAQSTPI